MIKIPNQEYTTEFRELAVKRYKEAGSISGVAKELGLVEQTLRNWVKAAEAEKLNGPGTKPITPGEITPQVIADIKDARIKEASKSTANRYLALIRSILIRARDEWEWCDKVPKVKLYKEPTGRVRFITPDQVKVLLGELPPHQRDIVLFALQTGLRQSNVLSLEWANINLDTSHMWVRADDSKNGEHIAVPLSSQAMEVLYRQINKHPVRVFTYKGKPIATANTRAWRAALKRAGIENFRWHDLRHTWASWHRMSGTPTHELKQLGGWKSSAMVERYAHLASDHLSAAAARLDSVRL
jgi:integrase